MILVVVNEDGKRYECYGKTIDELRKVQDVIREKKNELCPACGEPMQVRIYETGIRTNHFYHLGDGCGHGLGESEEHLFAKTAIRKYLEMRDMWEGCRFEFEYRIDIGNGEYRIIDLAVFHPDGRKEAHEAQLSHQGLVDFEERTKKYKNAGFEAVWWLGRNNLSHRDWVYKNLGWVGEIEIEDRPIRFGKQTINIGDV